MRPQCDLNATSMRPQSHNGAKAEGRIKNAERSPEPLESKAIAGEAACFWDVGFPLLGFAASPLLIARDGAAGVLFGGVMGFIGEHPLLGAAAATAFLPAYLLNTVALGGDVAVLERFNLV